MLSVGSFEDFENRYPGIVAISSDGKTSHAVPDLRMLL